MLRQETIDRLSASLADALQESAAASGRPVVSLGPLAPRVRIPLAAQALGMSVKAIQRKIEDRKWRLGKECFRDPDGNLWVDIKAVMLWIEVGS